MPSIRHARSRRLRPVRRAQITPSSEMCSKILIFLILSLHLLDVLRPFRHRANLCLRLVSRHHRVNVIVPLPSLTEECDEAEHKDHAAKNDQRLEVHGGLTYWAQPRPKPKGPTEGQTQPLGASAAALCLAATSLEFLARA